MRTQLQCTVTSFSPPGASLHPRDAAALLRRARRAQGEEADELTEWALLMLPHSRAARRLRVKHLLADGEVTSAEPLLVRGLLRHPDDVALRQLRAMCLLALGRAAEAEREIRFVLAARPQHTGALETAGRIARALGRPHDAAGRFRHAADGARDPSPLLDQCARALIDAGEIDLAEETILSMSDPSPLLRADALLARGRALDAADVLEASLPARHAHCKYDVDDENEETLDVDERLARLLAALEQTGDMVRLDRAMTRLRPDLPRSLHHASLILLARGRFRGALRSAIALLRHHPAAAAEALPTIIVAASLLDRRRLAEFALERWTEIDFRSSRGMQRARVMADRWRRGLLGRLIRDQFSARRAGADPSTSILGPLLRRATATFE